MTLAIRSLSDEATARFSTETIWHGGSPCAPMGSVQEVDGVLVRANQCGREILAPDGKRIEQRWVFEGPGERASAIRVAVSVEGADFRGRSRDGLVFEGEGGRFRYGHGTWIDASGERTAVPARWSDHGVLLEVPEAVVRQTEWPATLDPIVGVELGTDPPIAGITAHRVRKLAAAKHPDLTVVAWSDYEARRTLRVARIDGSGTVLDPYGVEVADGPNLQDVEIAASDSGFLIVWGYYNTSSSVYVRARTLARDGTLGPVIDVTSGHVYGRDLAVASDGTDFLIGWRSTATSSVWTTTLSAAGVVGTPVDVGPGGRPALAWDGSAYRMAWLLWSSIQTRRLNADGSLADPSAVQVYEELTYGVERPAVSAGPSGALVSWEQSDATGQLDIHGRTISPDGTLGTVQPLLELPSDQYEITAAWGGAAHWISAQDDRVDASGDYVVPARRFDASGTPLDATPVSLLTGSVGMPRITVGPNPDLVVLGAQGIELWRLDAAAGTTTGAAIPVAWTANRQIALDLLAGDGRYFVAWIDDRVPEGIYAAFFDPDGIRIGGVIPVAVGTDTVDANVRVGFDGTDYLVAWNRSPAFGSDADLYATRVTPAGTLLDPGGRLLFDAPANVTTGPISHDGSHWLFTWHDLRGGGRYYDCYLGRFDADLMPLDGTGVAITDNQRCSYVKDSTALPGVHFVQWQLFVPGSTQIDVRGARVRDGVILDAGGLVLGEDEPLGVATDGTRFVSSSVWYDKHFQTAFVDPTTGALTTQETLYVSTENRGAYGGMAYDGTQFLVGLLNGSPRRVEGLSFDSSGTLVESPFPIDDRGAPYNRGVHVASLGAARSLVAYTSFGTEAPEVTWRIRLRTVGGSPLPDGAPCAAGDGCASGFCVDGVCCETECGGGATDDCSACSLAAGAAADGTCGPAADGTMCGTATACTGQPLCDAAGSCMPGTEPDCDDGDPCTADSCADPDGCAHTPIAGCGDDGGVPAADAGVMADGGPPPVDMSVPTDGGGPVDAGVEADAGVPANEPSGCGCRTAGPERSLPPVALLGLAALVWAWRRRDSI